jgi:hypothetical protein
MRFYWSLSSSVSARITASTHMIQSWALFSCCWNKKNKQMNKIFNCVALLVVTGCILAFHTKDIDPKYGEAKQLGKWESFYIQGYGSILSERFETLLFCSPLA